MNYHDILNYIRSLPNNLSGEEVKRLITSYIVGLAMEEQK